ncbi:MAG: FAD-dependent oxidoreductase, partial [Pseudomonadota bacterium]
RYATYCGSSPYHSPATLMLIAHIEQKGVWTVDGGIYAVARAFQNVAELNGASFHFNADVQKIVSHGKNPVAIQTADGHEHKADAIIFNGDVATLQQGALGGRLKSSVSRPSREQRTQSAMTWAFCAKETDSELSIHNVYFSSDYRSEFRSTFEKTQVPTSPTVYVFAPDAPSSSQEDQSDRYFCLVNAPSDGDARSYTEKESEQCRENMIAHLRKCGLKLEIDLETLDTTTPADFARRFPHTGGALFGKAQHGWRASFQRPGIRTRKRGLYCAGGSVHPGAGIPMTALSGYMAAQSLIQDYALT